MVIEKVASGTTGTFIRFGWDVYHFPRNGLRQKNQTYSREDFRVVTHRSTNSPVSYICMAEC
jgi:hypothetical protein